MLRAGVEFVDLDVRNVPHSKLHVELIGLEPTTSSMPWKRSTN